MITVEFTEAEAQAVADAVRAYIDDDYYPAIDLEALGTAYKRLAWHDQCASEEAGSDGHASRGHL
jgi:hypothetical protein